MMSSSQRSIPTVDRISDLPDSILCHILSFFPTIFAATTSVLSKRWKSVWLSVLALDFDHEAFNDFESFYKFVYLTMFSLRDKKTSIHSFTLKCGESSRFNQTQLNRIFKFVMKRGVENLNFDMSHKKRQIKLPLCILSFKTLEVLKLSNTIIGDFDQIGFPLLKTLYLNKVCFISHENIVKFLSGCPILEDLEIEKMLLTHQTRLPVFHNLTSLKLSMHLTFWPGECSSLLGMLQHFPKLQHFNIQDNAPSDDISCKCWKDPPTTAPECLSSQLKTCYISGYKGTECYFKFAKYILQHSNVLEIMRIKTTFGAKNQMLLRKLSSVTTGSPTCKLLFD